MPFELLSFVSLENLGWPLILSWLLLTTQRNLTNMYQSTWYRAEFRAGFFKANELSEQAYAFPKLARWEFHVDVLIHKEGCMDSFMV